MLFRSITLRGSSVGPVLGLLPNGHQFESPQGHWRFTRSLTSGHHGISRGARKLTRTSTVIKKKIQKIKSIQTRPYLYFFLIIKLYVGRNAKI